MFTIYKCLLIWPKLFSRNLISKWLNISLFFLTTGYLWVWHEINYHLALDITLNVIQFKYYPQLLVTPLNVSLAHENAPQFQAINNSDIYMNEIARNVITWYTGRQQTKCEYTESMLPLKLKPVKIHAIWYIIYNIFTQFSKKVTTVPMSLYIPHLLFTEKFIWYLNNITGKYSHYHW